MKQKWIKKIIFSIIPLLSYILVQICVVGIYYVIQYKRGTLTNNFITSYNDAFIYTEIAMFIISIISFFIMENKNKQKQINWLNIKKIPKKLIIKYIIIACITDIIISIMLRNITLIDTNITQSSILLFIIIGLFTPISEEIIFRYFIYNILRDNDNTKNNKIAALIQGILFGLMHGNIIQVGYSFAFGYMFAKINEKDNSILPGIIMHTTINITSLLFVIVNHFSLNI